MQDSKTNTELNIPLEQQLNSIYNSWYQILNTITLNNKSDIKSIIDSTPKQDLYKYLKIDDESLQNVNRILN